MAGKAPSNGRCMSSPFVSSQDTLVGSPSGFLMMMSVGAGPLAASKALCSLSLVFWFDRGRHLLDGTELGAVVVHLQEPFSQILFLAFPRFRCVMVRLVVSSADGRLGFSRRHVVAAPWLGQWSVQFVISRGACPRSRTLRPWRSSGWLPVSLLFIGQFGLPAYGWVFATMATKKLRDKGIIAQRTPVCKRSFAPLF